MQSYITTVEQIIWVLAPNWARHKYHHDCYVLVERKSNVLLQIDPNDV